MSSILTKQERAKFSLNILLDFLIGLLDIVFLGLLLTIINFYSTNQHPVVSVLPANLFDKSSLKLISLFLCLYIIKNLAGYLITKSQSAFFYEVASRLSKQNMLDYLKSDYYKFVNLDSSVYTRKISQQPIEFSNYVLTNIQQIISQSILIFFTIAGILFYHPSLFISLFILLMPPVIVTGYYIKSKLKDIRTHLNLTGQLTLQYLKESLSGYIESNIYNKAVFLSERYQRSQKQLNGYIATQQALQVLPSRLIEVFAVLGFMILIAINRYLSGNQNVGLLDIGVFMAAAYKIIPGVVKILNSTGQIKTYEFTLNDLKPGIGNTMADTLTITPVKSILLQDLDFAYRHSQVLSKFCVDINPGDFIGISGPSGWGKTTMVNLLLGFLEQDAGKIYINDKETTAAERQSYWSRISYAKQQCFFINDTILKNITLSDKDYDTDKLLEVSALCGLNSIIEQYPEGFNKLITENGKNISGGQKQRLTLARALYHDFDLLILDEPFSELDEYSEKMLLKKLQSLAQSGKMIIMITHHKASLSFCNKLVYMYEQ